VRRSTFCFIIILYAINATAQNIEKPLYLDIIFPQHSDTINADRIRLAGNTDPAAVLEVNGRRINLFPQGSFVTRVDLKERMNQIIVVAKKGERVIQDILFIYRTPVLKSFASEPTKIDKMLIEPKSDVWLQHGDYLDVTLKASPGGNARFSVAKIGKNFPMIELAPNKAKGVRGIYKGVIKVSDAPANQPLKIIFEIQGEDGKKKKAEAAGKVYLLSENIPLVAHVKNGTYIHGAEARYLPLTRVPKGTRLHVIGRSNRRYKINLENRTGFVDVKDINLAPWGTPLPRTKIGAPQLDSDSNWLHLSMSIDKMLPYFITQTENPLQLQLQVVGAQQASHWITYPNGANDIRSLVMNQIDENIFQLTISLEQENNWGYRCYYEDDRLHFLIRREPTLNPINPLEGITIAVDPGHGGDETGAISPLGVPEKDINIQWAESLSQILRQHGAYVLLTRQGDETVSLPARAKAAENSNALLYISLHNNGVTPHGNAEAASGTSTFFTLPQNKDLTWAIYPHMVDLGLSPYGRIHNSYFVTNATGFLTTLVEGGFLTHPTEELKLADPEFINQMARAVHKGIVDFLWSRAE
jgi:N-acetylmuramoyl-L-alanine amidase